MGIVSRFERKLQSAVGDAFARVFGGSVLPQEVESALEREAADRVRALDGGHRLAPNSYVISINSSDHERLAADHDLAVRTFSTYLDSYIREQGWQTYGDVRVEFEASPNLHTGQFRAHGRVDPDAGSRSRERPTRGPDPHPNFPQPGAGHMTQNPGHDPGGAAGEPDDAKRGYAAAEAGAQRNGAYRASGTADGASRGGYPGGAPQQQGDQPAPGSDDRGRGPGSFSDRSFSDRGDQGGRGYPDDRYAPRGGYPPQPGYGAEPYQDRAYEGSYDDRGQEPYEPRGYEDAYRERGYPPPQRQGGNPEERYGNDPQQSGQRYEPGYADHGYSDHGYPEHEQGEEGYRDRGQVPEPSYQDPRYDGSYAPPAQPGAGYGGDAYSQQPGYAYPGYNAGYERRDYNYSRGYDRGGYSSVYTATLQLDDGSGRMYQLREGSNVVGRGQDAHFRLPDTGVSRRHFEIRWDGQVAMLGDLGSTNGTSVNGATVQDWQLADGDVIRAGHSDIIVRIV
ncbi:DUF3662 domain-containing protein [Aldersonia sp. NBC_00410]|uniref:FhaA domain-containing protein n=1 Tax=Aldersonia sp. NBC_00410 TaxID=2975954 RepID=UPI0022514D7F|nr:FhaA domain-containing protein [Aldersonia sp. NBC_00410]MCX5045046.1 DUF3662 domain-containing protein [Aldersonia sp. NBC_00410]